MIFSIVVLGTSILELNLVIAHHLRVSDSLCIFVFDTILYGLLKILYRLKIRPQYISDFASDQITCYWTKICYGIIKLLIPILAFNPKVFFGDLRHALAVGLHPFAR